MKLINLNCAKAINLQLEFYEGCKFIIWIFFVHKACKFVAWILSLLQISNVSFAKDVNSQYPKFFLLRL